MSGETVLCPGSSSLLPHIVLHEAGLPFTAIKIDGHSKVIEGGGDYKKVNPLGYVPALVLDDGTLLTEGAAIVQYIADQVPSKKLVPPNGTIERAMLQAWLNFCSSEMHKGGFSPLFYKGVTEEGKKVFRLMGRDYSVADAHLFVISNWASWVQFDLSPYANVISYRGRIGTRAAVRRAMEAEGLIPWPSVQPQ